jgi:hypothetical protein
MTALPFRMAHRNLLVGHGSARTALYRLDCVSYPFLSTGDKRAWLRRLARLAHGLEAGFSLYRVCRAYPAHGYAAQAAAMLDARRQDPEAWHELLAGHESHLRRLRSWVPEVYLAVSLDPESASSLGAGVIGGLDRARRRLEAVLGVTGAPISEAEVDALVAEEERVFGRLTACAPARRATTAELQWLLRRAACRGVCEPMLDEHWEPAALRIETPDGRAAFEPLTSDLVRHVNAPVLEEDRCLVVDAEEARPFQAMLTVGALPEQTVFPGTAEILMSALEAANFPADCVLHSRRISNRDALTRVRRRIVDADNAYHEQVASAHGPLSYVVEENRQFARTRATGGGRLLHREIGILVALPPPRAAQALPRLRSVAHGDRRLEPRPRLAPSRARERRLTGGEQILHRLESRGHCATPVSLRCLMPGAGRRLSAKSTLGVGGDVQ